MAEQNNMENTVDLMGVGEFLQKRYADAAKASSEYRPLARVNELAKLMHPKHQKMKIVSIKDVTPTMRSIRFEAADGDELAYFSAGQYIPVYVEIDGNVVERPYSLISSPEESIAGFYEICVKRSGDGYISNFINDNWKVGMEVTLGAPDGFECYTPLRDAHSIIGVAGGSGVTPFRSMAKAIVDGTLDIKLTLIYGCQNRAEIAFAKEWPEYEKLSGGKFKCVPVLSDEAVDGMEQGFITEEIIRKYAKPEESSLFISGPQGLMNHMHKVLDPLGLRKKFVRFGIHGDAQFTAGEGWKDKEFTMTVHQAGETARIPMRGDESVLRALEKAGLKPPVRCRSGICGFCRSYLIQGEIYIASDTDGVRSRDRELGFIHPCCSFPKSDLEIVIQRG